MKLYFLQFSEKKSPISAGKIKPQAEGFIFYKNKGVLEDFFLAQDISDGSKYRVFDLGSATVTYKYGMPKQINRLLNWKVRRKHLFCAVFNFIIKNKYTHIYIRRPNVVDSIFIDFLAQLKERRVKIIYDIPTYPYDGELPSKKLKIDRKYRKELKRYVDLIVSPSPITKGNKIFGIPFISIPNGVVVDHISVCQSMAYPDGAIHAIAVAGLSPWHGYDRFITGMHNYYRKGGKRNIVFHIVGGGASFPVYQQYKELIKKYALESHVILHGMKFGKDLDHIYNKCNIAVASLAFHRTDIYRSSALKTREYLAKGLPMYASTRIDILPEDGEFVHYCSQDESPVDMDDFIGFYDCVYTEADSYITVHDNIREFARKTCDIRELMRPLMEYIAEGNIDRAAEK